jgi:hypothetical protein
MMRKALRDLTATLERVRPEDSRKLFLLFLLEIFALLVVFSGLAISNSRGQVLSTISAVTERVTFEVIAPAMASFPIRGMRISAPSSGLDDRTCRDGLFRPARGVKVTYGRIGRGPLEIEVAPQRPISGSNPQSSVGTFEPGDGSAPVRITELIYFESDGSCTSKNGNTEATPNWPPLPIWGRASIGSEFHPLDSPEQHPTLLLSGTLKISGRAIEILPSVLHFDASLYRVGELELPVGSRLETFPGLHTRMLDAANWWGVAYGDPEKPALDLQIATDTPKLALYRPDRSGADVIELTTITQIFDDPNLIKLYKIVALMGGVVVFSGWVSKTFKIVDKRRNVIVSATNDI